MSNIVSQSNPDIIVFINTVNEYILRQPDKALPQLQRQLEIFSVTDDLSIFEPSCVEKIEFYHCLDQLLSREEPKSSLAWKIVSLLIHLSKSKSILYTMRDGMLPVLSSFLMSKNLSRDKYGKTLDLIQKISHGIKVERTEPWVHRVVPHLSEVIEASGRSRLSVAGQLGDTGLLLPALQTLANIWRNSDRALWAGASHRLPTCLLTMSESNKQLQLVCMELYFMILHTHSNAPKLDKLQDAVPLTLMVCLAGVTQGDAAAVRLASDALQTFAAMPAMVQKIMSLATYSTFVESLSLEGAGSCVPLAASMLTVLVRIQPPLLVKTFPKLVQMSVGWLQQDSCCGGVLELLLALAQTADHAIINSHLKLLIASVMRVLDECSREPINLVRLSQVCEATQLLQCLAHRDKSMAYDISLTVPVLLATQLAQQLQQFAELTNDMRRRGEEVFHRYSSASQYCNNTQMNFSAANDSRSSFMISSVSSNASSGRSPETSALLLCSETIVRLMLLVKELAKQPSPFVVVYKELMGRAPLIEHVAACFSSSQQSLVELASHLLVDTASLPSSSLQTLVTCICHQRKKIQQSSSMVEVNGNVIPMDMSLAPTDSPDTSMLRERVEKAIKNLKGFADNHDKPKLVELYEYKMDAMAYNEEATQDMINALNNKIKMLQRNLKLSQAESSCARQITRETENHLDAAKQQLQQSKQQIDSMMENSAQLKNIWVKERTAMERDATRLRGSISAKQKELDSTELAKKKLAFDVKEAYAEMETMKTTIATLQSSKEDVKQRLKEREAAFAILREKQEEFAKKCAGLEQSIAVRHKENLALEKIIEDLNKTAAQREQNIEEQNHQLSTMKRIQDMIHDMSKGNLK